VLFMLEVNLMTKAASQTTVAYNSMCKLGEKFLGVTDQGLFLIEGYNDHGVQIPALVKSGMTDFGIQSQKRFRFFYFGVESDGDLVTKVFADGTVVGEEYSAVPIATGYRSIRIPIARTGQARYWGWSIENVGGSFFSLYSVKAIPVVLHPGHN
jgi:hypothetical protein